jgi:iron complex transport system substrate-binding protein
MFSALKAVRERRVYRIPPFGDRLDRFVPDHPVFLSWAAELLYPKQMANDTRNYLRELYRRVFAVTLSEAMLDRALLIDENGQSADYDRFHRSTNRAP